MECLKKNYKFKNFYFVFIFLFFSANKIFSNETDKREYEKSCAHWVEDRQKIEFFLKNGQPVKILTDNYVKKNKQINLIIDETEKRKKYILQLDNNIKCVFTEYSLAEIKEPKFDLIMYDLCRFLDFGNVTPIVWRDNLVIDGKKHRGTLQLFFEKLDIDDYDAEDLQRSMSGISQKELDEYRIFNLLLGTWETSLEKISICGGAYLVHDDASNMKLKQVIENYDEIPFVLFHECHPKQVSNFITEYEDFVKKNNDIYEEEKLKARKERQIFREQLEKQKIEEEKKLQEMKNIFQKQKEDYYKQQQENLRQQEEFRKQQEEMFRQQQMYQNNVQQNFLPNQNLQNNFQQPTVIDPFQNIPDPVNPQIDYLEQQIKFLDEQDILDDIKLDPFPFYSSLPLTDYERNRIACYYAYNPPSFDHNYIIWKRNYWLQFSDSKTQQTIKHLLFPKFLTSKMKEKLQQFTKVRALEFFLKSRYYRMKDKHIEEYINKCLPYVEDIMERKDMLLNEFERREIEANKN